MSRRSLLLLATVAFVALLAAPLALAEPEGEAAAGHAAGEPPPLLRPDLPVAITTIVVFLVLLVVLSKTAWTPILKGLRSREEAIRAQIQAAETANAEAKRLLDEHSRRMTAATDEARAIVEEGRKDAESLRARIEAEATAEAGRQRDRALKDIDLAKQGAVKELYDQVAVLATDVAAKILQQRLDPQAHRRLVDEAVASFESSRKKPGGRA
jgi:F-type H+-transporting ATPase subunit b